VFARQQRFKVSELRWRAQHERHRRPTRQTISNMSWATKGPLACRCGCDTLRKQIRGSGFPALEARMSGTERAVRSGPEPRHLEPELEAEIRPARGLRLESPDLHALGIHRLHDRIGDISRATRCFASPGGPVGFLLSTHLPWLRPITPYTTWTSVGRRFSDNANLQLLRILEARCGPFHARSSAGRLSRRRRQLDNVIGLTEGDPRAIQNVLRQRCAGSSDSGRSLQASIRVYI